MMPASVLMAVSVYDHASDSMCPRFFGIFRSSCFVSIRYNPHRRWQRVNIFPAKTIRGATKIPAELRYRIEVRLLRRRRQIADRHVLDHAAAKRADLSHRKISCLKGWVANPRSSQTGGD